MSRYYDPEMGRFINADKFIDTEIGMLSNNMFTYYPLHTNTTWLDNLLQVDKNYLLSVYE
ncbi:MAG: hypothetical protein E7332_00405 [Clostridiales bacterium]|nr:hypothetical protein [Clostridiales bacterium]